MATEKQPTGTTLQSPDLQHLADHGFLVVEDFLPSDLQNALKKDVMELRQQGDAFRIARIGHDGSVQDENTPFRDIRYSETCSIGKRNTSETTSTTPTPRQELYELLDAVKQELQTNPLVTGGCLTKDIPRLDTELEELMYAYYPQGGYYRRHRDAEAGSISNWRKYSFLLYLNDKDWKASDGGQLRIHLDSGGDELPPGELPNFVDVDPKSGTLVLFRSDQCPHEVLDTRKERIAIVGWFLSQEQDNGVVAAASAPISAATTIASNVVINANLLEHLRALRDANPRLKSKLNPQPLQPQHPPSALSIFGDDFFLPGASATTTTTVSGREEDILDDTDTRYWKKIATFDTKGNIHTLSLSGIRLVNVEAIVPTWIGTAVILNLANSNLAPTDLANILRDTNSNTSATSYNKRLQQIRLGGNGLGESGLQTILQGSMSWLESLTLLDLRYNDMGPEGGKALVGALKQQKTLLVRTLYLEGNRLGDDGAGALASLLELEEVYLGQNEIGPEGAAKLAPTATRHWKKLYLEGNHIGTAGAKSFLTALLQQEDYDETKSSDTTTTLEKLYVDNNGMDKDISQKLGAALGSPTMIGGGGLFQ